MQGIAYKNLIYEQSSDRRVEQIGGITTNADYEILLSGTSDDNYYIGETRKTASLTYNPSTKNLINYKDTTIPETSKVITQATISDSELKVEQNNYMWTGETWTIGAMRGISVGVDDINTLMLDTWDGTNSSLKDALAGKVSKSGDTISGDLVISKSRARMGLRTADWTITTASNNGLSADAELGRTQYIGKDGSVVALNYVYGTASGEVHHRMYAYNKKTDGTGVTNIIDCIANKDGTRTYYVSDQAAFRSAIGAGTSSSDTTYSFTTKTITGSATTFSAGEVKGIKINITNSGYKAFAIRGVQLGNVYFMINEFYLSSDTAGYLQLWNRASNSQTVTPKLMVAYYKQN